MPGKCKFFAWLVLHGRCWMLDRLRRHGLRDTDVCALCAQEVETLDHLTPPCRLCLEPRDMVQNTKAYPPTYPSSGVNTGSGYLVVLGQEAGRESSKERLRYLHQVGWSFSRFGRSATVCT
jgi:hypothetical protein